MDIVEFLARDHEKLRAEMKEIRGNMATDDLKSWIEDFIKHYELHESVEEEILFPRLYSIPGKIMRDQTIFDYEKLHTRIWALLDHLMRAVESKRPALIRAAFKKFTDTTETHFHYEEGILFPGVRQVLEPAVRAELGEKAQKQYALFMGSARKQRSAPDKELSAYAQRHS